MAAILQLIVTTSGQGSGQGAVAVAAQLPISQLDETFDTESEEALAEMEGQAPAPSAAADPSQLMPAQGTLVPTSNPRVCGKQRQPTSYKTQDDRALAALLAEAFEAEDKQEDADLAPGVLRPRWLFQGRLLGRYLFVGADALRSMVCLCRR